MSNNDGKNFLIPGVILLGFIILAVGIILGLNAYSFRVGTINSDRINTESTFVKNINGELQTKGKELSAKMQAAKTEADKSLINEEFKKFQAEKSKILTDKVKKATAEVAKKNGIKAVSSTQVFIFSDMDLTDAVIKELDK